MQKTSQDHPIPDALRNFDELPNAAHVRQPVLEALLSCSGPTIWRRTKAGELPKPRKLSARVTAWNVGELRTWLEAQGREGQPAKASEARPAAPGPQLVRRRKTLPGGCE